MSLAETYMAAQLEAGKTQKESLDAISRATGYNVGYSTISRWKHRHRNPEPAPRIFMMKIAIPHVIKGLTKKQIEELTEALS